MVARKAAFAGSEPDVFCAPQLVSCIVRAHSVDLGRSSVCCRERTAHLACGRTRRFGDVWGCARCRDIWIWCHAAEKRARSLVAQPGRMGLCLWPSLWRAPAVSDEIDARQSGRSCAGRVCSSPAGVARACVACQRSVMGMWHAKNGPVRSVLAKGEALQLTVEETLVDSTCGFA